MNDMRVALAQAGIAKAAPLLVMVMIEDYSKVPSRVVREYVIDYNDEQQRRVFAAQCRNAIEGGQCVSSMRVDA